MVKKVSLPSVSTSTTDSLRGVFGAGDTLDIGVVRWWETYFHAIMQTSRRANVPVLWFGGNFDLHVNVIIAVRLFVCQWCIAVYIVVFVVIVIAIAVLVIVGVVIVAVVVADFVLVLHIGVWQGLLFITAHGTNNLSDSSTLSWERSPPVTTSHHTFNQLEAGVVGIFWPHTHCPHHSTHTFYTDRPTVRTHAAAYLLLTLHTQPKAQRKKDPTKQHLNYDNYMQSV